MYYEIKHYRIESADTIAFVRILGREFSHFTVSDEYENVTLEGCRRHVQVVRTISVNALPSTHNWIECQLGMEHINYTVQN